MKSQIVSLLLILFAFNLDAQWKREILNFEFDGYVRSCYNKGYSTLDQELSPILTIRRYDKMNRFELLLESINHEQCENYLLQYVFDDNEPVTISHDYLYFDKTNSILVLSDMLEIVDFLSNMENKRTLTFTYSNTCGTNTDMTFLLEGSTGALNFIFEDPKVVDNNQAHALDTYIQIAALKNPSMSFPNLEEIGVVEVEKISNKNLYRYVLQLRIMEEERGKWLSLVKEMGYEDAFIIQ